jgi:hypothetical protein
MDEQQPNAVVAAAAAGHGVGGLEVDVINLTLRDCFTGAELAFKVRLGTLMGNIFMAYCSARQIERESVRFLFEGCGIVDEQTCTDLELEDEDLIDVITHMYGD